MTTNLSRRTWLSSLVGMVVGGKAVEALPVSEASAVCKSYLSGPMICLLDFRTQQGLMDAIHSSVDSMIEKLPESGKWQIRWVNVFDQQKNPMRSAGFFVAMPASDQQRDRIAVGWGELAADLEAWRSEA